MICRRCGAVFPDAACCPHCGFPTTPGAADAQPYTSAPTQQAYPQYTQPDYTQPAQPIGAQTGYQPYMQPAQPSYQQPSQPNYQQPPYQQPNYQQPPYQQPMQQPYPQQYQQGYYGAPATPLQTEPPMPMKWFKFLIYFSLFASALINLANAGAFFSGFPYIYEGENYAEMIYSISPSLKTLDYSLGIFMIVLAVYTIVVRFMLAGYRKAAPIMLYVVYILNILSNVVYSLVVPEIISSDYFTVDNTIGVPQIFSSAVFLVANIVYFNKRKHLFVK